MKTSIALVLAALLGSVPACGGGGGTGDDTPTPDAPVASADADPAGWQSLIEGDWSLAAAEEGYFCVYATVPRDIYLKAFQPLIPLGTHHTVLTVYTGTHPDGVVPCDVGTNGQSMIYGSGVGSPEFHFPTGVGLHLTAGSRLLLNLHLFNASDNPITGRSGTKFLEATPAEIQNVAELVLAGPTIQLNVPTGTSTQSGVCHVNNITSSTPLQVFALSQHMHTTGRHMRSVIDRGGTLIELQDIDYAFENQTFQLVQPTIEILPGDLLTTYCTFENTAATHPPSGAPMTFGESTLDEMCFTDLFYYPAQGAQFICTF